MDDVGTRLVLGDSEPIAAGGFYDSKEIAGAGDVNGDGFDDIVLGAPTSTRAAYEAGAVYVVQGPVSGTLDLANADTTILGGADGDSVGQSVSSAGDYDGDGFDDIVVGTSVANDAGGFGGRTSSSAVHRAFSMFLPQMRASWAQRMRASAWRPVAREMWTVTASRKCW